MSDGISNSSDSRYIYNFNNTGGTYRKERVKLFVFDNYFNSDGVVDAEDVTYLQFGIAGVV